jgi:hypothetical protein
MILRSAVQQTEFLMCNISNIFINFYFLKNFVTNRKNSCLFNDCPWLPLQLLLLL